ncbi:MAG: tRNA1(Val) (adenine(37)-N6)-methyltransferase [Clostridiales bacterium]|nr:tRNA1(Val) (adenine(37)-N6)-methyltransferase [Clostridiales bacterium]
MEIGDKETLEDLQVAGLKILQKTDGFRFGADAVLLADFAKDTPSEKTLDLCCGSGIIPILLSHKTKTSEICGIEIQEDVFETAQRSVMINGLSERVKLTCGDLKNATQIYGKRRFDVITCNPPYMPVGTGVTNPLDTKLIARHEVMCTLEDVIAVSAQLLKQKGHLMLVHKPGRLADIICLMRKYEIEPKRIRFVHKGLGSEPCLVLADGAYKGGRELRIAPTLYLYNSDGSETEELKRIYER